MTPTDAADTKPPTMAPPVSPTPAPTDADDTKPPTMSPPVSPTPAAIDTLEDPPAPPAEIEEPLSCKEKLLILLGLFLLACLIVVLIYATTTRTPRLYVSDFSAPPLNSTKTSPWNVFCQFTIFNKARLVSLRYHDLTVTVRNPSGQEASAVIPKFYQWIGKRHMQRDVSLQFGPSTLANRSATGEAVFRVSVLTEYRNLVSNSRKSSVSAWYTFRKGADVVVNAEGKMISREKIQLVNALYSAGSPGLAAAGCLSALVATICAMLLV